MAIVQYNNGLIDQFRPMNKVFSELEIIDFFGESENLRSRRLLEVANSWCIWGEASNLDENEFNALGSKIVEEDIFTKLLIIHDSEIDPNWNLTDRTILNTYSDFKEITYDFIDSMAIEVIKEKMEDEIPQNDSNFDLENDDPQGPVIPKLRQLGHTEDKKFIFELVPSEQSPKFWNFSNFSNFASRSFEYLHGFIDQNLGLKSNAFVIYSDKKGIIIVKDPHVEDFMHRVLKNFEEREKYHGCSHIMAMTKKWQDYVKNDKKAMTKKWQDYLKKLPDEKK